MDTDDDAPTEPPMVVSRAFPDHRGRMLRIASKPLKSDEEYTHAIEKDEIILRVTASGRQYIKATFYEDNRRISVFNLQRYGTPERPYEASFALVGEEIDKLYNFIGDILRLDLKGSGRTTLTESQLAERRIENERLQRYLAENPELAINLIRNEITSHDVVALAYRKRQLEVFRRLLNEAAYFAAAKEKLSATSDEAVWQAFFEKNTWIFGYGLQYAFTAELLERKLEQVLQGSDLYGPGKRPDGVMKTRGLINFLCLVEIKTPGTPLLASEPYRVGCWAPSGEISGAVAQLQFTVRRALEKTSLRPCHKDGAPTGEEIFQFAPSSFVIIGSLAQFQTEKGVHEARAQAFELYRANLTTPEILTFDELYERAKYIVAVEDYEPSSEAGNVLPTASNPGRG